MKNLVLGLILLLGVVGLVLIMFGNGIGISMLFPLIIWGSMGIENKFING